MGLLDLPLPGKGITFFVRMFLQKIPLKRDTTWTQKLQQVAMGFPPHQFPLTPMLLELPAYLQLLLTQLLARARNILPLPFHYRPI